LLGLPEPLPSKFLIEIDIKFADLGRHLIWQGRNGGLFLVVFPCSLKLIEIADTPVVLPHELLAHLNELSPLIALRIPEPVLVCRSEGVDEHEVSFRIKCKFLFTINMDEASSSHSLASGLVIVQAGASDAGRQIAAETAEAVFTAQPNLEAGRYEVEARWQKLVVSDKVRVKGSGVSRVELELK